jgi:transcriptional regulator with XRE-family HTH domain
MRTEGKIMSRRLSGKVQAKLENKEYRQAFAESFLNSIIATQLRTLRCSRGLSQGQLASLAGMKQSRISALENVNYSSWSINTLQRLAAALDVALSVRFESFGKLVNTIEAFSTDALQVPSFGQEKNSHDYQDAEVVAENAPATLAMNKSLQGRPRRRNLK